MNRAGPNAPSNVSRMALIKHVPGKTFEEAEWSLITASGEFVEASGMRLLVKASTTKSHAYYATLSRAEFERSPSVPQRAGMVAHPNTQSTVARPSQSPDGRFYWAYAGSVYETADADLTPEDVLALANESANRRRMQLEKAHALQAMTTELEAGRRRKAIPQDVKITVWQRDGGRCVDCESKQDLEFDHIIPLAMGGANTSRNLQLLCGTCNRRKGATLG